MTGQEVIKAIVYITLWYKETDDFPFAAHCEDFSKKKKTHTYVSSTVTPICSNANFSYLKTNLIIAYE